MGESDVTVEIEDNTPVQQLWQSILTHKDVEFNHVMVAVNMEYVTLDHRLKDGDEVAFFPPVTGG